MRAEIPPFCEDLQDTLSSGAWFYGSLPEAPEIPIAQILEMAGAHGVPVDVTVLVFDLVGSSPHLLSHDPNQWRYVHRTTGPLRDRRLFFGIPGLFQVKKIGDGGMVTVCHRIRNNGEPENGEPLWDKPVDLARMLRIGQQIALCAAECRVTAADLLPYATSPFCGGTQAVPGICKIAITTGSGLLMPDAECFGPPWAQADRLQKAIGQASADDEDAWSSGAVFGLRAVPGSIPMAQIFEAGMRVHKVIPNVHQVDGDAVLCVFDHIPAFHPGAAAEIAEIMQ